MDGEEKKEAKRYYWLRLHDDFFLSRRIKKLRRQEHGDTLCLIYLKMQLAAMKKEGLLSVKDPDDPPETVLADDIDEEESLVKATLDYLIKNDLAEWIDEETIFFPYAVMNTGSETAGAQRVREFRERQRNNQALQCNTDVTEEKRGCCVENKKENNKTATADGNQIYPTNKNLFLTWCREHDIPDAAFAADFYDRYKANGWTSEDGRPIRNWQHFATAAWKKEKKEQAAAGCNPEKRSYTADDCVEYPPGSGSYIGREEWERLQHG